MERAFLDTNVAVYAYAPTDMHKRDIAHKVIQEYICFITPQVIKEFCAVCVQKRKIPAVRVREAVERLVFSCTLFSNEPRTSFHALEIHDRYGFHFYDSSIIAAAVECGCKWLFSEDMNDGQRIGATEIKNIFI